LLVPEGREEEEINLVEEGVVQLVEEGMPLPGHGGQPVADGLPHHQSIAKILHFKMSEERFHFK
ncbi:MAG: hypothetical protein ACI90V_000733, partial [Bacillariaceae sp.]